MKLFSIISLIALSSFDIHAQAPRPQAVDDVLNQAFKLAGQEKKNVLILFHASWCVWCHRMDTSMNDKNCRDFFEKNYVIRHLVIEESAGNKNLENPGGQELLEKYHGKNVGIPFWLVFNSKGVLLADSKMRKPGEGPEGGINIGCPASESEVNYFLEVLKKTTTFNQEQLEKIRKRFRENEAR